MSLVPPIITTMAPKHKSAEDRHKARLQSKREHYQWSVLITQIHGLSRYSMNFIYFLLEIRLQSRQSHELVGACVVTLTMYVFP